MLPSPTWICVRRGEDLVDVQAVVVAGAHDALQPVPSRRSSAHATQSRTVSRMSAWNSSSSLSWSLVYSSRSAAVMTAG